MNTSEHTPQTAREADTGAKLNAPKKDYCAPMHTAEHVLNGTMDKLFGCGRAFSAHIEAKKSKCDYRFERAPSDTELSTIEKTVNEVLRQNLPVTSRIVTREEAAKVCDLSRLPTDASETLKLVYIGTYDVCPCIGKHVSNTQEVGTFRILSHDYKDGVFRLRWKIES